MINLIPLPNGRSFEVFCMIKTISEKVNKNNEPYLDMIVSDKDGEINAKLWSYNREMMGSYESGDVVKIRGTLSQYNGQDQLSVSKIRLVAETDDFDYSNIIPTSEYPGEKMLAEIYSIIAAVKDEELKKLTMAMVKEAEEKMLYWPAAFKLHHAMRGGLLYHTLSILRMAQKVSEIYPSINKDLLYCGVVLHDICKIDEFEVNNLGMVKNYSVKGELLGHLVMGAMKVDEKAKELEISEETATLVEHMLISHHGTPEYGSSIRPMFLEAIVLSSLDTLDATIYEVENTVKELKTDEFSDRQWALDNRKLFNHGRGEVNTKAKLF